MVKRPWAPSGKQRPCGTLLQLVVVVLEKMHRIGGSVEALISVSVERSCNTTHFLLRLLTFLRDSSRRAVWVGRRPAKKISVGPKDKLTLLGNQRMSARAKACLTAF